MFFTFFHFISLFLTFSHFWNFSCQKVCWKPPLIWDPTETLILFSLPTNVKRIRSSAYPRVCRHVDTSLLLTEKGEVQKQATSTLGCPKLSCTVLFLQGCSPNTRNNMTLLTPQTSGENPEKVLQHFRPSLRALPRLHKLIQGGLGSDGLVWLKMPPANYTAGQQLSWCKAKISSVLSQGPHVYKIGITADPIFRFYKVPTVSSPSPGYYRCHEKFKAQSFDEASLMEAALIEAHVGKPGCRNVKLGGEGRRSEDPPFFTCAVYKLAM